MNITKVKPWDVFRYSDYRVLWVVLIFGSIVSWMRILGTAQWLLDETNSAYLVGLIGVVQLVVQIPVTLWAGNLADRLDRKKLMTYSYGLTALVLAFLATMNFNEALTPTIIYFGIAVTAGTHMLASPARAALIPIVVAKNELMLAVSTDTASSNAAAIAGPLLFAFVAVTFGLTEVFLIAALIASVSAILPFLVKVQGFAEGHDKTKEKPSQVQQTKDGFDYVSKHPILPGLFLLDMGITTASFYREILPVLALGLFAGGASVTGMLGAANSAGAILGSFIALLFVAYKAQGMLVLYASFAYGFILFGFGLAGGLVMGLLMIGLLGAADAVTVAVRQTTVMLTTPDHMRGRAFALMILTAQTANNIGTIWVGTWAGIIGANNTMLLGGVISIIATALIWLYWKPIRVFRADY
ncbi:MAG: MFS transporter [Pseudomonadales bacterium]|nr:MFS transporter [Pseudomonadales bacterium]